MSSLCPVCGSFWSRQKKKRSVEIDLLLFRVPKYNSSVKVRTYVCCFVSMFSHDAGYNKGNRVSREWYGRLCPVYVLAFSPRLCDVYVRTYVRTRRRRGERSASAIYVRLYVPIPSPSILSDVSLRLPCRTVPYTT